jgi:cytidylate kinase
VEVTTNHPVPKLITFDGEARSGKGTIVQRTKDALRDDFGYKVMLIDAGQVFRCLVVAAQDDGVNLDNPAALDTFLSDDAKAESSVQFVKSVYHMSKSERDALLYSNDVSVGSAKVGARPLSQDFKDELLKKWLRDAREDGYDIVLLDGRALEETGTMLESQGLCEFVLGLYFVCDPRVGAMRTLGFAARDYEGLSDAQRRNVDQLVEQINERNRADRERKVQPIVPPAGAPTYVLPDVPYMEPTGTRFMATIDTSAKQSKDAMTSPVIRLVSNLLKD